MSSFSKYIFAPWVRQGISNNINETDTLGTGTSSETERAEIAVKVNWSGGTIEKSAQLIGPGDIKSISQEAILKVSPLAASKDMESNYFPFIEFYEPDFPWRYTPASPTENVSAADKTKLRPWLALVVLEDENDGASAEFEFHTPPTGLPYIKVNAPVTTVFHTANEHWAWAHVQYNPQTSDEISSNQELIDQIVAEPDRSLSRILCPRKLGPSKNYRAFLIPAFETGRLAGLDEPITGITAQMASWNNGTTTRPTEFPVYKEWSFTTTTDGDFESLAKRLRPTNFGGAGGRKVAVTDSGYGLHYTPGIERNVKLEGALQPVRTTPNQWPEPGNMDDAAYVAHLSNVLNLNASLSQDNPGPVNPTLADNPFTTTPILDDPIVSPPMYGQWHFLNSSVPTAIPQTGTDKWFSQVNLNPSWRMVAGLGAKIVRENQESFMERAWQQMGSVNKANDAIRLAEFVKWANGRIADKRIKPLPVGRFMKMYITLLIRGHNGTGDSLLGELTKSELPNAVLDNGFRKMTRNRSVIAKKAAKAATNITHPSDLTEAIVPSFEGVTGVTANAIKVAEKFKPLNTVSAPASSPDLVALETQVTAITAPAKPSFDLDHAATGNARTKMAERMDPFAQVSVNEGFLGSANKAVLDHQIVGKISQYNGTQNSWSPIENRKPIMAYPQFNDVLADYLKKIDVEYILPEIDKISENSVAVMETNPKFIEALMLGLNHEMSRELLWREFPTDQRGTYFKQFWDKKDSKNPGTSLEDISVIDQWNGDLGDHTTMGATNGNVVLIIKGDLLKKFPDTVIYAQKAGVPTFGTGITTSAPFTRTSEALPLDNGQRQTPSFSLRLAPDIVVVGFDLTHAEVQNQLVVDPTDGSTSGDPGWYFVFAERPGKPRFGLDTTQTNDLKAWQDLEWHDVGAGEHLSAAANVALDPLPQTPDPAVYKLADYQVQWGASAAEMAYITFQSPAFVAIHAEKMLPI